VFESHRHILADAQPLGISGEVESVRGLTVAVAGFPAPIASACRIVSEAGGLGRREAGAGPAREAAGRTGAGVDARVIGFTGEHTLIMPLGPMAGIRRGDRVVFRSSAGAVGAGAEMLGRVLNGLGEPIDGLGPFAVEARMPLWPPPIPPMARRRLDSPLATGVRVLDAMLTTARGQRMGIFSGSGVGKSVLLGMIGRYTAADVNVISLVGERGREVRDFLERDLGADGLKRSVVVVSTSDEPPLARVQAAAVATAIAEFFRERGRDVLLLMDSLTRLALAQRMVGLAAGEPPATRGFPPSVFNLLPELLERSGRTATGSITGFYTVLVEGDDRNEPISDAVRAVTDGHIWLSRDLLHQGHYPAVDVLGSVSRVMSDVVGAKQAQAAREVRMLLAAYAEVEDLLRVGAYKPGSDAQTDLAVVARPLIRAFLAQKIEEPSAFEDTQRRLHELSRRIARLRPAPSAGGRAAEHA
jgi:flagellum-specific ATP synthase